MKRYLKTSSAKKYLAAAFLLPCVGMLMVMLVSQYHPFGRYSMLYSDMYHQYYPFFVEYRQVLRSGGSLLHNWSVGMGVDYLALISYYLASPLNLLSVLVPERFLLDYFSLLVPIKLGLAGLFFGIFLNKTFKSADWSVPLFSICYALCAWAMGYLWNIMWLDTFALLPLAVLGTVYLLRDKRFGLYVAALFLSVASNYYIGLFTCIFIALSFMVWEICQWKGIGRFFADLCRIAFFSVLAIGMTAFLELPAFMALQNTQSSVNAFPKKFDLNIAKTDDWKGLLSAMRQVAGNVAGGISPTFKEGLPNLYCSVLAVLLGTFFCTSRKIRLREKLCSCGLLLFFMLSFIIRQLDYVWHGFHFTNMIPYRFSYLFSFVLLVMAYRAYLLLDTIRPWQVVCSTTVLLGICACSEQRTDLVFVGYNLAFLALYTVILWNCAQHNRPMRKPAKPSISELDSGFDYEALTELSAEESLSLEVDEQQLAAEPGSDEDELNEVPTVRRLPELPKLKRALCMVLAVELTANLVNFGCNFTGTNTTNYPRGTADTRSVIGYMKTLEANTLFYRAEFNRSQTLNDGALNRLNGVSIFSSSANVNMTKWMQAMGFGAKPTYNRYCYEDTTPVCNLFLGVKYMIDREGEILQNSYFQPVYQTGSVTLLQNTAYLPLGFCVNSKVAELDVEAPSSGTLAFQSELFAAATGIQKDVYRTCTSLRIDGDGTTVNQRGKSGYCTYKSTDSAGGTVRYQYTVQDNGVFCFSVNAPKRNNFTVLKNGETLYSESISLPQIFHAGSCLTGDVIEIEFKTESGKDGSLDLEAMTMDAAVFDEGYSLLSRSPLELQKCSDTELMGTVSAVEDCLLYTSVPDDGNWVAQVDGQTVEIRTICGALVGIPLSAGTHTISLFYRNAAFSLGCRISGACVGAFFLCILITGHPKKRGKYQKRKEYVDKNRPAN